MKLLDPEGRGIKYPKTVALYEIAYTLHPALSHIAVSSFHFRTALLCKEKIILCYSGFGKLCF